MGPIEAISRLIFPEAAIEREELPPIAEEVVQDYESGRLDLYTTFSFPGLWKPSRFALRGGILTVQYIAEGKFALGLSDGGGVRDSKPFAAPEVKGIGSRRLEVNLSKPENRLCGDGVERMVQDLKSTVLYTDVPDMNTSYAKTYEKRTYCEIFPGHIGLQQSLDAYFIQFAGTRQSGLQSSPLIDKIERCREVHAKSLRGKERFLEVKVRFESPVIFNGPQGERGVLYAWYKIVADSDNRPQKILPVKYE